MHLLALGAFWPITTNVVAGTGALVLMHLLALGAFWRGCVHND